MNDEAYLNALRVKALDICDKMQRALENGKCYPHVMADNLRKASQYAAEISVIAQAAEVGKSPPVFRSLHDIAVVVADAVAPKPPSIRRGRGRTYSEGEANAK